MPTLKDSYGPRLQMLFCVGSSVVLDVCQWFSFERFHNVTPTYLPIYKRHMTLSEPKTDMWVTPYIQVECCCRLHIPKIKCGIFSFFIIHYLPTYLKLWLNTPSNKRPLNEVHTLEKVSTFLSRCCFLPPQTKAFYKSISTPHQESSPLSKDCLKFSVKVPG